MPNPVAPALQTAAHLNGATRLTHLGVLRATGEDAIAFLQGQLTQDVALLPAGQTRLAAYCTPRGRVLTSFWVYKTSAQQLLLLASADRLAATLGRLQMYVLRAKVTLSDATAEFDIRGLLGDAAGQTPRDVWLPLPPADGAARALWLAPAGSPAPAAPPLTEAQWLWAEVRSGVARITAPVVEAFIPQMLNYESLGGVSFKKGCYTGQEVVARSQFRGTVKRRAFVAWTDGAAQAGQDVFSAADPQQSVGQIAQAAPDPAGGTAVIVVMQQASAQADDLHAAAPDGPALRAPRRPYPLLEEV